MRWSAVAFVALAACAPSSSPAVSSPAKQFRLLMEKNQKECDAIKAEAKDGKGDSIRLRLKRIRENSAAARTLRVLKTDADNEEIDDFFHSFISTTEDLAQAEWSAENGEKLVKRLEFRCTVCHSRFRD